MKKVNIVLLLLFIYILFYKTYLTYYGAVATYIINPLVWMVIALIAHYLLKKERRKEKKDNVRVLIITTILSLLYIIIYYAMGVVVGYTNNPYTTTFSGYIINLFSIWFVTCIKEYIRYLCINANVYKYKIIYYYLLFLLFLAIDLNFLSILESNNFLTFWSKELTIPIVINLLMMYLAYVGNIKTVIISRSIIMLPALFLNVVPDYDWFIVTLYNIIYCLTIYLAIKYFVNRNLRNDPINISIFKNYKKPIVYVFLMFLVIAFGLSLFPLKPVVILTSSMHPLIKPGDMVIIKNCSVSDLKVGDIIGYRLEDVTIVHRVVSFSYINGQLSFITKGDANKKIDKKPVKTSQIIGKLEYNIPFIGYPAYLLQNIVNNKEIDIE